MTTLHEQLSAQYLQWELRGRGWFTHSEPVALEPPFIPFPGYRTRDSQVIDDARHASGFERLLKKTGRLFNANPETLSPKEGVGEAAEVTGWRRESCHEILLTLPRTFQLRRERMESLLRMCRISSEPVSFEILADDREIGYQWVCSPQDAAEFEINLNAHLPGCEVRAGDQRLLQAWQASGQKFAGAEIGLGRDFLLSLETGKSDFLPGLLAALSSFAPGEMGLFQLIFEPVSAPWGGQMMRASTLPDGSAAFRNRPDLPREAATKARAPLYAVILRLVTCAQESQRAWAMLSSMVVALNAFARAGGNYLVPLALENYPAADQEEDILLRQSHRWGMLLSQEELLALLPFPQDGLTHPKLRQESGRTRACPLPADGGLSLGWNEHAGARKEVFLSAEQRVRHVHVIGGTGTGKTTFLLQLIRQDLEQGLGFALLDPHGDLVDQVLSQVPELRQEDVVLMDAGDEEFSAGFNILNAHSDYEKTLLASDLVGVFQRLSTSWGDQMAVVLRNAILAFLEHPDGGTLADVQRFLLEPEYRNKVLAGVTDADVAYYWRKGFPQLGGSKSIGPVLTRLQTFLSPKPIRYMVTQRKAKVDIPRIMDGGKILLAKLPQGLMGAENSYLLGSLLVSKIQQAAMARQRLPESERQLFTLYVDEFQNFITPSMAEILSGARKYRLALVLAHQELEQLSRSDAVASAVLANAGTRVVFRVGDSDARELAKGFAHFDAAALQSLSIGQAIARVERSDQDFNLQVPPPAFQDASEERRDTVVALSRSRFATPRTEIENAEKEQVSEPAEQGTLPALVATPATEPLVELSAAEDSSNPPPDAPPQNEVKYETTSLKADLEELGRGGDIHKAAQAELKKLAEARGFRATIERQLPDSLETVDLYLEKNGAGIACEISVTNSLEYEMRNVTKCLRAGVAQVLLVTVDGGKRQRLAAAVASQLPDGQQQQVHCLLLADVAAFLDAPPDLAAPPLALPKAQNKPKMVKGWKVRTQAVTAPPEDLNELEQELAATLAETLRRQKIKKREKK